jgi:ferric-dicitrate binding protein FerR (iron transport regulator)
VTGEDFFLVRGIPGLSASVFIDITSCFMNVKEAQQFVANFVTGEYSAAEHATFLQWLRGASVGELNRIADQHESQYMRWAFPVAGPSPEWVVALEERLDRLAAKRKEAPVVRMSFSKRAWVAAAAIAVLMIGGGVWYTQFGKSRSGEERQRVLATLTQTFAVARGGEQQAITLSDGSRVWLNAASTLKYPTMFSGSERVVELSGEAFFDVTQRSNMPFRVLFRGAEVKVLGTHFTIMAYDNEPVSRTTLIDGSIRVESGSQQPVTLHIGEQGEIPYPSPGAAGPIKVIPGIDPSKILAWKDGVLKFDSTDLHAVMRTLERCYNVDIQVGQNLPKKTISGTFSRSEGLRHILKQLELYEHLHFTIDGNIVTVTLAT